MNTDQTCQRGGKHPDMGREKALQREGAQVRAAAQSLQDEIANEWNAPRDLRSDRGSPIRGLIPWEQIASEAHAEC